MGAQPTVIAYIVWVSREDRAANRDGYYLDSDGRRGVGFVIDPSEATHFDTRADAESFVMLDSVKHHDLIGTYEVRAIVAGYAIRYQRVESRQDSQFGENFTLNETKVLYVGTGNSIVSSIDEAAKFRTREKAEEISFSMALKDKSLLGAMEVVEIHHIQRG
jgi:hypothetical protein